MTKRKRSRPSRREPHPERSVRDLNDSLEQAEHLIETGRVQEAIQLLEPLLERYPRIADVHYYLGYACAKADLLWKSISNYEKAMDLRRDPDLWTAMGFLYIYLELRASALHAFQQAYRHDPNNPILDEVRQGLEIIENEIRLTAETMGLNIKTTERGLRFMEEAQIALHEADYTRCATLNRQAIRILGDWPPPHNNLSLAQFFNGEPEDAIQSARRVLDHSPENIQALANIIRFLAWTGREEKARGYWNRLKELTPEDHGNRMKMVEAAAIMEEDETVYQFLKAAQPERDTDLHLSQNFQLFFAIAEANTDRHRSARRRLKTLKTDIPWAGILLEALEAGKPGPGWSSRFPYFHANELIPFRHLTAFFRMLELGKDMPEQKLRREVERFVRRFPQIVKLAEKFIWEDMQVQAGISLLSRIGTPEAYAALRRFGLSQAGSEQDRLDAISALSDAGEISQDETLRMWQGGEWREIKFRKYEIVDDKEFPYSPKAVDLLDQGLEAFEQNDYARAEDFFRQVLELEPQAKEAYNNLGTIYARQDNNDQARKMFYRAIEIDPLYILPRCNLAIYLLGEDQVDEAADMIAPLFDVSHFRPQEMAYLSYIQARIMIHRDELESARKALDMALEVYPDYELAAALRDRLDLMIRLETGWGSWQEELRIRDQAKRDRLQQMITTPDPSLSEALGIYTKNTLTAIGRAVLVGGGWSTLKKADLRQHILESLQGEYVITRVVSGLNPEDRKALSQVLSYGGSIPWETFDAAFGNDLDESPYWQYHLPNTTMGRLRERALLVETTVDGVLHLSIPVELREPLLKLL